jgi:hypothetical protein
MSLDKLFSLPLDTPGVELECRIRLDIPNQEIMKILNKKQIYIFKKVPDAEITDYNLPVYSDSKAPKTLKEKYRLIDGKQQVKRVIESTCLNLQGYTIKFDLSVEEYVEFPENLVVSQQRVRSRDITTLNDYSELHLTVNKTDDKNDQFIEIEYDYKVSDPIKLIASIKLLFDTIYVESTALLTSSTMIPYIEEINKALRFLKTSKRMNITPKDIETIKQNQLLNFEDKPVSLDPSNINAITSTTDYYVTNKLNGIRYFMLVFDGNIYLASRGGMKRNEFANLWSFASLPRGDKNGNIKETYIFDGEYYNGKMWLFDALMFNNNSLVGSPYEQRLYWVNEFVKNNSLENISMKVIYKVNDQKLDINNLIEYCKQVFGSQWVWENDGLIFNHRSATYIDPILKTYKWKFQHHQTIDVSVENKLTPYTYDIGVKDKNSTTIINKLYKQKPLYNPTSLEQKSIVEVQWVGNKAEIPFSFVKTRTRADKIYPNYIDTVNSVWKDIQNPIPLQVLTTKMLDVYDKKTEWFEYRKYSNYRKDLLIKENIKKGSIILDIGFGKGGDLLKYKNVGVKKIYAFEPDRENIIEFFKRYNLRYNVVAGSVYNIFVEGINIILFYKDALDLYDPQVRSLIKDPIDTVCLFFSLTYFFGSHQNFTILFNSISYLTGKLKIIGTVMDGSKALNMLQNYTWNPIRCGLEMQMKNDQVYIKIEESQTVRGHWEYLVEWNRLEAYLNLYGYRGLSNPYDYQDRFGKLNYSLIQKFAGLNMSFIFEVDNKIRKINNILLRQSIFYNQRLGLPKDSKYFTACHKEILSLPGQLDGLLAGKPIQKDFIQYIEGKIYLGRQQIKPSELDNYRCYLMTSKPYDIAFFTLVEEVSFDREKYYIKEPVKITNIVLPTLSKNMDKICEIIQENVSISGMMDIYDMSIGVGIFTMKLAKIFASVKSLVESPINRKIFKHNIDLLPPDLRSKVEIIGSEDTEGIKNKVIFIDKFLFEDEFDIFEDSSNILIVRCPENKFNTLPLGFTKIYYMGSEDGFIVFYDS